MREIATSRFGRLEYNDDDIISFPKGIPGFDGHTEWVIAGEEEDPIKWLQSVSDGNLALPVTVPFTVKSDYHVDLCEADLKELGTTDPGSLAMFVVLTIPSDAPWNMRANLRAPIVVNPEKRAAKQIIAMNDDYSIQQYVLDEAARETVRTGHLQQIKAAGRDE